MVSALVYSVISEQVPKAVVLPSITFTYSLMAASLITLTRHGRGSDRLRHGGVNTRKFVPAHAILF